MFFYIFYKNKCYRDFLYLSFIFGIIALEIFINSWRKSKISSNTKDLGLQNEDTGSFSLVEILILTHHYPLLWAISNISEELHIHDNSYVSCNNSLTASLIIMYQTVVMKLDLPSYSNGI